MRNEERDREGERRGVVEETPIKYVSTGYRYTNCHLQVSVYGPNVNWRIYELLKEHRTEQQQRKIVNLGSCGLHTIHRAFQHAISTKGWGIEKHLAAPTGYLTLESPAKMDDYTKVTESKEFPFKLCQHRWVENIMVASRLLLIIPNLRKYIDAAEKKEVNKPTCK